jgi:hypothetical protein
VPQLAEAYYRKSHQELEKHEPLPAEAPTPLSLAQHIEIMLHQHIKNVLQLQYGLQEHEWWVQGVPLSIRQECASMREGDLTRDDCYAYIYLIDMRSIVNKNWALFESDFRRIRATVQSKREFLDHLGRLNDIRNRYSHPIRAPRPNSAAFSNDLGVAQLVKELIAEFCASTD